MIAKLYLLTTLFAALCISVAGAAIKPSDNTSIFAYCDRVYDYALGDWSDITLYGIGWGNDSTASHEYHGCGALTQWTPSTIASNFTIKDNSNGVNKGKSFKPTWGLTFTLPIRLKQNCMGRAVESSGGPAMKCEEHP